MRSLFLDLRSAIRALYSGGRFTTVAVLTLAIGIASTAIFSIADAVLNCPFPWPDLDRIVVLSQTNPLLRQNGVARRQPTILIGSSRTTSSARSPPISRGRPRSPVAAIRSPFRPVECHQNASRY